MGGRVCWEYSFVFLQKSMFVYIGDEWLEGVMCPVCVCVYQNCKSLMVKVV